MKHKISISYQSCHFKKKMAFESFAKALYEEASISKRKIMNGLGNYTDIPGHLFRLRKQPLSTVSGSDFSHC